MTKLAHRDEAGGRPLTDRTRDQHRDSRHSENIDARGGADSAVDHLFEAIANYTYDWESWIGPDGKPRWVNPAVERMTGYSVAECLAMPDYPLALINDPDRPEIRQHLDAAARGESGNDIAFRIKHRDGSLRWAAVSYQSVYDNDGRSLGYRTSARDFTERKRVEEAIRRAHDEADRANRSKARFLAAASHDLRQPLQAANLFLAALKSQGLDDRQRETVGHIDLALRATGDLLDALLDVSRLDAGVLEAAPQDMFLQPLIDRLADEFAEQAAQKGLALRVVPTKIAVRSDPKLLERVLRNLIANALRYTESGGALIGARRRGARALLGVWDTGIGIPAAETQRIFEEFFQIGNPERDRRRGLGLGLAIVERVGRLLDHPVTVRSVEGRGSVFEIAMPIADAPHVSRTDRVLPGPSRSLDGVRILAIDDEPMQRRAMAQLFGEWGCIVVTGSSGYEAVEALTREAMHPDVIVADYRLRNERTGADAIRMVRHFLNEPVPGILITGDTEATRLVEAKASGFELLHKPVDPDRLRATIAAALG